MTTAFEFASVADTYQSLSIGRVADPYSVYNSLGRASAAKVVPAVPAPVTWVDTADFSGTSAVVAAALSDGELQTERIAALRQSIADGTYRISADVLAGSILKAGLTGW